MRVKLILSSVCGVTVLAVTLVAQQAGQPPAQGQPAAAQEPPPDDVRTLVTRLELEKFKATLKGLTQFGDRREGTQRNRDAVNWIEAQLKSFGCPTGRLTYEPPAPRGGGGGGGGQAAGAAGAAGQTGQRGGGQQAGAVLRPLRPARPQAGQRRRTGCGAGPAGCRRPARRWRRRRTRSDPRPAERARAQQLRRIDALRQSRADGREQQRRSAAERETSCAQRRTRDSRTDSVRVLHEGRDDASERDVHHRRAHGRHRLGRSRE